MELKDFIKNFASQFYETDASEFKAGTVFKEDIEEWSSLSVLLIIAMINAEYNVTIDGSVINNAETIEDLFNAIKEIEENDGKH